MEASAKTGNTKAVAAAAKRPRKPECLRFKEKIRRRKLITSTRRKILQRLKYMKLKGLMKQRAEKYMHEYRRMQKKEVAMQRDAKKTGNFYVPAEPKLAFVVRLRGINGIHPQPRKILQLFRLRQINNGMFVRLNKVT
uniref:60S ribosomal protein L7 n=1 Tax=Trichobilharzia regenti TaxID=157069 RepID=A0AA85IYF3_TRIRE|nr:unnamed protein product [Trichobilharzia regenti]